MKIEKKEISQTNMEFKIILEKEEVDKLYNKTVNYFKHKYMVPGFRKGKAPAALVKKMYKEAIDTYFELNATDEYLQLALMSEKENPINTPEFIYGKMLDNGEYEMLFKFEKMPKIDIKKYKDLEVEYIEEKVTDKMIEDELRKIQLENSFKQAVEDNIQENYLLDLEFYENENDETPIFKLKEITYNKEIFNQEFNDFIKTARLNDKIKTKIDLTKLQKRLPEDYQKDKSYIIKITGINRIEIPKLDDDFAKDINFDSLDDLKNEIKSNIQAELNKINYENKLTAIKVKIIELNPFNIPQSVIYDYSKKLAKEYYRRSQDLEKIIPLFKKIAEFNIKSYLAQKDIIKKENITITDEDIEDFNRKKAEELSMHLENYKELYKSQIEKESYKNLILEEKYNKFLLENNKFIPIEKKENSKEKKETQEKKNNKEK